MSTGDRDLRTLLTELHDRLRHAKSVDPDSRTLLATVAADIEGALELRGARTVGADKKLQALAAKFEVEHPALAEVVRDVVDALGKAGI
jgi:hypothetical protein